MKKLLAILFTISLISCNTKKDCSYQKPIDINDGLNVSTLENHNLDKSVFDKINQDICNGTFGNPRKSIIGLVLNAGIMLKLLRKCNFNVHRKHLSVWVLPILLFFTFHNTQILAQNTTSTDSAFLEPATAGATRTLFGGKITNSGYGGFALKFSSFNNQFAIMTGGRGAATINNRYTIGGGGYGIANSIDITGSSEDTSRLFKMGYGGIELGYIILQGKKVNIGASMLLAGGAAFWQNKPKSDGEKLFDDDFRIFPVLEPSLYSELDLNRFMWLHAGISYRYVHNANLDYITDQNMRGFSCYLGLLFGKPE